MTLGRTPLWTLLRDQAPQPHLMGVMTKDICAQWASQSPDLEKKSPYLVRVHGHRLWRWWLRLHGELEEAGCCRRGQCQDRRQRHWRGCKGW